MRHVSGVRHGRPVGTCWVGAQPGSRGELILAARGIAVSYESIRDWGLRFGRMFANTLKRRRPRPGDKWFLDEEFIRIRGEQHYLWRVQSRRNAKALLP
jgi:putative transposase